MQSQIMLVIPPPSLQIPFLFSNTSMFMFLEIK